MNSARMKFAASLAAAMSVLLCFAESGGGTTADETAQDEDGKVQPMETAHALDASTLVADFRKAAISSYKCWDAVRSFEKAIASANAEAVTNHANIVQTVQKYLKTNLDKAQATGDLERTLAFRKALATADGEIEGELEEIVKLRSARNAQKIRIDNALIAKGAVAAKALYDLLEWQKKEMTKKGDVETAQIIADFQKKVVNWAKETKAKGQSMQIGTHQTGEGHLSTQPLEPRQQSSRQPVQQVTTNEPKAIIYTIDAYEPSGTTIGFIHAGDVVKIQYIDGAWSVHGTEWMESPDAETLRQAGSRLILAESSNMEVPMKNLPPNTKETPFEFVIPKTGNYVLRINDSPGHCDDNMGSVRYSVKIIPGRDGRVSPRVITAGASRPSDKAGIPEHRSREQISSVTGRAVNRLLSGTQTEESVTLAKTTQPHVVKELYIVPEGKELLVEAGVTIVFERGASLHCEGTLRMNGTEQAPIVCKGKMQSVGYWSGIRLRSEDAVLEWVQISGAVEAIQLNKNPSILNCAIFKNEKNGIHIGMNCAGGDARIVNCVIADNGEKGVDCHHGRASFENCTITRNGKFGMRVGYSGHVQMNDCKIEGNKGDGFCFDAGGQGDVHNSSITGNKGFDIYYAGGGASNFRECFWGQSITRMLQQRGDGTNLPNIKDGRDSGDGNIVDVSEFLTEPPKDCGATVKF